MVQNLYMPPLEQMEELNQNHQQTMKIVESRFRECQNIQERVKKLNKRVQQSNVDLAEMSSKEKKLAVFLVELNNRLI